MLEEYLGNIMMAKVCVRSMLGKKKTGLVCGNCIGDEKKHKQKAKEIK